MLEHANVMLLDEPTNHLDLPMKEVLEDALDNYTGTLLFVSHDRYFLKRLATQLIELTPEGMIFHPYGFEAWLEAAGKGKAGQILCGAASFQSTAQCRCRPAEPHERTRKTD